MMIKEKKKKLGELDYTPKVHQKFVLKEDR